MNHIEQRIAEILLEVGCVILRPNQPFTWASGIQSPIYCDSRLLMSDPDARREVCEAFCHLIKEKAIGCELVAGVATGAIPHAAWVAQRLKKAMVYIRGQAKEHGKQNQVEGKVAPGVAAVVIEDLVSTGGSSVASVEALRDGGAKIEHCLAIFSYGFPEALKKFEEAHCQLTALTNFPTLLQMARERRMIRAEEETVLKKFSADPWNWLATRK